MIMKQGTVSYDWWLLFLLVTMEEEEIENERVRQIVTHL